MNRPLENNALTREQMSNPMPCWRGKFKHLKIKTKSFRGRQLLI